MYHVPCTTYPLSRTTYPLPLPQPLPLTTYHVPRTTSPYHLPLPIPLPLTTYHLPYHFPLPPTTSLVGPVCDYLRCPQPHTWLCRRLSRNFCMSQESPEYHLLESYVLSPTKGNSTCIVPMVPKMLNGWLYNSSNHHQRHTVPLVIHL